LVVMLPPPSRRVALGMRLTWGRVTGRRIGTAAGVSVVCLRTLTNAEESENEPQPEATPHIA
jgi:hypothetical protein